MPLEEGSSRETVGRNISTEMHHGKPQPQAIAIAMRKAGLARDAGMTGERRGREIFYGARDQGQPALVTTPNAAIPAGFTQRDDD